MFYCFAILNSRKGNAIAQWPLDGYDFHQSFAVRNGKFLDPALDED